MGSCFISTLRHRGTRWLCFQFDQWHQLDLTRQRRRPGPLQPDHRERAARRGGASGKIITSPDGVTWTARTSGTTLDLYGVAFGAGVFVAVGQTSSDERGSLLLTSPDGVNWTRRPSGASKTLWNVGYGNGAFVAVGEPGVLLRSGSLASPSPQLSHATGVGNQFQFRFNGEPGQSYQVQVSTNLTQWTLLQTLILHECLHAGQRCGLTWSKTILPRAQAGALRAVRMPDFAAETVSKGVSALCRKLCR